MEFLYFLESIRTDIGDMFFSAVTHFGEETLFILMGLFFFWCVDKKQGYYLLSVGLVGTVLNQFLKLWFRIPRPWVRDPDFTIVESARAEATGYSFPSGHTQSAVGLFGGIARSVSTRMWRWLCIVVCVLVPLSRMYLGVHTPADVGVSIVVALALVFGLYPVVYKATHSRAAMRILFACLLAAAVGLLLFVCLYPFPTDIDPHNFAGGMKNACKMVGCLSALWIVYEVDEHVIRFGTKAVWWAQILKLVLGLIPLLGVKEGLRAPLTALCGNAYIADGVRYFLMVLVAGCVWPLTFPWFASLGQKSKEKVTV
ncbi:MAG: phosphatase PAP2 family protein [Clostridia bacterium]|nr:phosphatase PAP2 family protein [Clostridia bacterium]